MELIKVLGVEGEDVAMTRFPVNSYAITSELPI